MSIGSKVEKAYADGYWTCEKEKDYDPMASEAVCDLIDHINKRERESLWAEGILQSPYEDEPVLVSTGVVQHIVYKLVSEEDEDGGISRWFDPYYFDYEDELRIPYNKVEKWKYVEDLVVG